MTGIKETELDTMKKYQIIYADPPWEYRNYNYETAKRGARKEYPLMSIEQLKKMPINDISDSNCALFMWVTYPLLKEGIELIQAWGFEYKTVAFVWIKRKKNDCGFFFGMGNWTRSNSEIVLLGLKGKPKRINASISQLVFNPLNKHSRKPPEIRDKIVELMGDIPRIELFARTHPKGGWDVWGNEVESDIKLDLAI